MFAGSNWTGARNTEGEARGGGKGVRSLRMGVENGRYIWPSRAYSRIFENVKRRHTRIQMLDTSQGRHRMGAPAGMREVGDSVFVYSVWRIR